MYTVRNNKTGKILGKYKTLEEAEKIHGKTYPVDKDKDYMRWFGKQTTDPIVITNTGESYIERNNQQQTPTKGTEVEANPTYNLLLDFNPDGTKRSTLAKAIGGYDMYTGNPNYYHGNFTNDFLKSLGYAGITGAGIASPMLIPEVAGALNLYGAYHGLTNYAKDYHPIETFKKVLNGDYFGAVKDIGKVGWDVLEAAPFVGRVMQGAKQLANKDVGIGMNYMINRYSPNYTSSYNWRTGKFNLSPRATEEANPISQNNFTDALASEFRPKYILDNSGKTAIITPYNPSHHVQGKEAVQMFKDYGGVPIPKGSINGEQLMKYVPEARERYGLIGNTDITDEEIAQALYKHSLELGKDTRALNNQGEPQLLFRGDTADYTELLSRISPEELALKRGTMDNSLGNLFLGEFPGTYFGRYDAVGVSRYLNGRYFNPFKDDYNSQWEWRASETGRGNKDTPKGYRLFFNNGPKGNYQGFVKDASTFEFPNRLNTFIVRTPEVRNSTREISVLDDDFLLLQGKNGLNGSYLGTKYKVNPEDYTLIETSSGKNLGEITTGNSPDERLAIADHYSQLLKDAESKNQGLLMSERNSPLREEHTQYTYFALPNFNIRGAKHLLPYDLRVPRDWSNPNIYKVILPLAISAGTYLNSKK